MSSMLRPSSYSFSCPNLAGYVMDSPGALAYKLKARLKSSFKVAA